MFGGLGKFILIGLAVGAIWYGFKLFQRRSSVLGARKTDTSKHESSEQREVVEEMQECSVCQAYFATGQAPTCNRANCPNKS